MQKGFTIIELLIVGFIVGLLILIVTMAIGGSNNQYNYCEAYRYEPAGDTPVACYDYLD